jgi:uncharacterized protein (UPF0333 family)
MSSTYSSSLRIELIGSGDQAGAWGTTTNGNLEYILDTAIAGYQAVTVTSTNQALTYVNGASSTASLNESIYAMLKFNSAAAASAIYAPPASKQYIIWNNSGYTITIYNSTVIGNTTAAGTGVAITNGNKVTVWSDGTNFYEALPNTLPIANGGTGQTTQQAAINALTGSQTNNRVLRSDGTNATLSQVNVATDVTGTLPVANGGTGVTTAAAITALVGNLLFPVGSIYTNATDATNPGTLLGFGTWTAFGAGRVMVGFDAGNVLFDAAEETGGSADAITVSHTHTATSTVTDPGHVHALNGAGQVGARGGNEQPLGPSIPSGYNTISAVTGITVATTNASTGSSGTNANYQPYITVYMWKRTA